MNERMILKYLLRIAMKEFFVVKQMLEIVTSKIYLLCCHSEWLSRAGGFVNTEPLMRSPTGCRTLH